MHALKTGDTHARANDSVTLRDWSVPSTERSAFPIDSVECSDSTSAQNYGPGTRGESNPSG